MNDLTAAIAITVALITLLAFAWHRVQRMQDEAHERAMWDDILDRARRGEYDKDAR